MKEKIVSICYDFDQTLTTAESQEFQLIKDLGYKPKNFWKECENYSIETGMDRTLTYLKVIVDKAKIKGIKISQEYLNSLGKTLRFYKGVKTWFNRINKYGKEKGVKIEHYIISCGNKEIIAGSSIYKYFKDVFACEYLFDEDGNAYWPKFFINYSLKTQYIFRIYKGVFDIYDNNTINQRVENKHVQFEDMIYLGDGFSDVPCMTLVKERGGTSISIYGKNNKERCDNLLKENRVNFSCKADYSENSQIEKIVKNIIDKRALKD